MSAISLFASELAIYLRVMLSASLVSSSSTTHYITMTQ